MRFAFISVEKALYPVTVLCDALEVSTSGYYASLTRPVCAHDRKDDVLRVKVRAIHEESGKRYGEPASLKLSPPPERAPATSVSLD